MGREGARGADADEGERSGVNVVPLAQPRGGGLDVADCVGPEVRALLFIELAPVGLFVGRLTVPAQVENQDRELLLAKDLGQVGERRAIGTRRVQHQHRLSLSANALRCEELPEERLIVAGFEPHRLGLRGAVGRSRGKQRTREKKHGGQSGEKHSEHGRTRVGVGE